MNRQLFNFLGSGAEDLDPENRRILGLPEQRGREPTGESPTQIHIRTEDGA